MVCRETRHTMVILGHPKMGLLFGIMGWQNTTPSEILLAEFLCPNCRQPFLLPEKNRSVPRSCPYKYRENFLLISSVKLVQTETYLTIENPGILHAYPGMPAGPAPVLLRWAQSYILHTVHAAPAHPTFAPTLMNFLGIIIVIGQMILHQSYKRS